MLPVLVVLVSPHAVAVRNRVVHDTHDAKAGRNAFRVRRRSLSIGNR